MGGTSTTKCKVKMPPVLSSNKQTPKKPKLFTARSRFINTIDFQNGEDSLFTPFPATAEQSFIAEKEREKSFAESKQTAF
jgi:hypothetical protein